MYEQIYYKVLMYMYGDYDILYLQYAIRCCAVHMTISCYNIL